MKRYYSIILVSILLYPAGLFGQKDLQSLPELRKFGQQGWKIQHAHYSFDSLTIYFSALEPGKSDYDLYVTRSRAGMWNVPERMCDSINTPADELWPSVASDEHRLYFVRRTVDPKLLKSGHSAQALTDRLYTSDNIRGEWQQAEPSMVASSHDLSPLVLPDNQTVIYGRRWRRNAATTPCSTPAISATVYGRCPCGSTRSSGARCTDRTCANSVTPFCR